MTYKIVGALILGLSFFCFTLFYKKQLQDGPNHFFFFAQESECVQLTPSEQLRKLVEDDFAKLQRGHQLPEQWSTLINVEFKVRSDLARALLGSAKFNIPIVPKGTHFLEVEILDLPDETNPGIILQASLFDIQSKNKIFEIGRTYTMKDLNGR